MLSAAQEIDPAVAEYYVRRALMAEYNISVFQLDALDDVQVAQALAVLAGEAMAGDNVPAETTGRLVKRVPIEQRRAFGLDPSRQEAPDVRNC